MTTLREAAQQALAYMESVGQQDMYPEEWAIAEALRAALEQPEQEPVAWIIYTQDGKSVCVTDNTADFIKWRSFPLYTHPPRREWRGLTEGALMGIYIDFDRKADKKWSNVEYLMRFAKAIEAALKERNV